jgi:hypothetical protein
VTTTTRDRFVSVFPLRLRVIDLEHRKSDERLLRVNLQRKLVLGLAGTCFVVWLFAAVHPLDRQAWMLENLLLILFVLVLSFGHGRLQLSTTSHFLFAAFIILHIVGAH